MVPVIMTAVAYAIFRIVPFNPLVFGLTAVILVAWRYGTAPGIVGAVVTTIVTRLVFIPNAPWAITVQDISRFAICIYLALLVGALSQRRWKAEEALRKTVAELDQRVQDQTRELQSANDALRVEVAERSDAQAKLERADRMKDEFLAQLGHELRNPLAAISTGVTLLQAGPAPERRAWTEQMLARQVIQLGRLVDDLLDVARITRGKIGLRKERVVVRDVLEAAVAAVKEIMAKRNHSLSVSLPPPDVCLEADPSRLQQIVVNLLFNAAKYTPPGGEVTLTGEQSGGEVVIRCRDNGVGLSSEMVDAIFEPFVQVSAPANGPLAGLGLGLSLARKLAEMHGGSITAVSPGLGQGSEFTFRLAIPEEGWRPDFPAEAPMAWGSENGSLKVLVVDDNQDFAEALAIGLRDAGHEVMVAHDGETAVLAASNQRPDTVLLDIGLPDIDGFTVASRLRAVEHLGDTKIFVISGYRIPDTDTNQRLFDAHLVKPVTREDVIELLRTAYALERQMPRTGTGSAG